MKPTGVLRPSKRQKMWQEKQKKRGGLRNRKVKVKTASCVTLINPKSQNFAFCTCLNFVS